MRKRPPSRQDYWNAKLGMRCHVKRGKKWQLVSTGRFGDLYIPKDTIIRGVLCKHDMHKLYIMSGPEVFKARKMDVHFDE